MDASDFMNRRSWKNKYLQQSGTDTITKHKKEHKYSIFSEKKFWLQKPFFCNADADANDDADAEMPMPKFPNGLDKNTFWLLLPNNWIDWKFLHAEALKNFINRSNDLDYRS